jgi:hypothetical protein
LASQLVQLPKVLTDAARDLTEENPKVTFRLAPNHLPTSLTLLWPGDPALELLARRPRPPGVFLHSILGIAPPTAAVAERLLAAIPSPLKTDGVVPAASAHLDDVDSECVLQADHSHVHTDPKAAQEVRRILREHLRQFLGS